MGLIHAFGFRVLIFSAYGLFFNTVFACTASLEFIGSHYSHIAFGMGLDIWLIERAGFFATLYHDDTPIITIHGPYDGGNEV